ncbi:MAG: DUF6345 domain-containing protein [Deltaproteobacteria bacterium]
MGSLIRLIPESGTPTESSVGGKAGGIWSSEAAEADLPWTDDRIKNFLAALRPKLQFHDSDVTNTDFYLDADCPMEKHHLTYVTCHGDDHGPIMDGGPPLDVARATWGRSKNLKWLVFDTCRLFRDEFALSTWQPCFQGLRSLFGFVGMSSDMDGGLRGEAFARHLCAGVRFRDAWRWASQESNPWLSGSIRPQPGWLRAYDATTDTANDTWLANAELETLPMGESPASFELLQHYVFSRLHDPPPP